LIETGVGDFLSAAVLLKRKYLLSSFPDIILKSSTGMLTDTTGPLNGSGGPLLKPAGRLKDMSGRRHQPAAAYRLNS